MGDPTTAAGRALLRYLEPMLRDAPSGYREIAERMLGEVEAEAAALTEARSSDLLRQYRDALERLVDAWDMRGAGSMQALLDALDEARALLAAEVASSDDEDQRTNTRYYAERLLVRLAEMEREGGQR